MAEPLGNDIDEAGRPVCPVCRQPMKMTDIVIGLGDYLVHFNCRDGAPT